jgi:hypothetical protein
MGVGGRGEGFFIRILVVFWIREGLTHRVLGEAPAQGKEASAGRWFAIHKTSF